MSRTVSDTKFYLLSKSGADILQAAKFEFDSDQQPTDDENYLQAAANAFLSNNREDGDFVAALVSAELAKHRQADIKTNAKGRVQIRQLKPGKYYLFGMTRTGDEVLIWNQPIDLNPGVNTIELDQYNAAISFFANE